MYPADLIATYIYMRQFTYGFMPFVLLSQSHLQSQNCEDAVSTASSVSGSEEKTINAVCEQMKVSYQQFCGVSLFLF